MPFLQVKDIYHDNLNAFVGACVDPGSVCLVTRFCTRGNLKDILENNDINLDLTFKTSFAMDIVNVCMRIF